MNQLESKLRESLRNKADRIPPDAPPLRLSGSLERGRARRRTASRRKWLAAAAASVAVAAVAVAAVTVSGVVGSNKAKGKAGAAASALSGVPPYYVILSYRRTGSVAELRVTRTKALIATIRPPHPYVGFSLQDLAGAANDQEFALLAETAGDRPASSQVLLLHIDPGARSPSARTQLTALHLRYAHNLSATAMAFSPDGSSLAVMTEQGLIVYNLKKGTSRYWEGIGIGGGSPGTLSWTSNGLIGYPARGGFGLLDSTARGTSLEADLHVIHLRGAPDYAPGQSVLNGGEWRVALISPDGRWVFISVQLPGGDRRGDSYGDEDLLKFSARTGRLAAVVSRLQVRFTGPQDGREAIWEQVLWMNNSGSKLIVTYARPGQTAGILSGKSYTPIPWPADTVYAAW